MIIDNEQKILLQVYSESANRDVSSYHTNRIVNCTGKESLLWECSQKDVTQECGKSLQLTCDHISTNKLIEEKVRKGI